MTLRRHTSLLWLAGAAIVAGLVLVFALRTGTERTEPATSAPAPAAAAATTAHTPAAPAATVPTDTPPWLGGGSGGSQKAGAPAATRALSAISAPAPSAAEQARTVATLREQAVRNERTADELLRQIDTMQATGQTPPGVNLEALRSNLLVTKRAQVLARELAELTQQPQGADRQQRILAITSELQQLQGQLRYDVGTPTAAVPASPPGGRP